MVWYNEEGAFRPYDEPIESGKYYEALVVFKNSVDTNDIAESAVNKGWRLQNMLPATYDGQAPGESAYTAYVRCDGQYPAERIPQVLAFELGADGIGVRSEPVDMLTQKTLETSWKAGIGTPSKHSVDVDVPLDKILIITAAATAGAAALIWLAKSR